MAETDAAAMAAAGVSHRITERAAAVAGPSSQPVPSSAQLREAINQLTHLQRIVVGDNSMSIDELLAATASGGPAPQSIPDGGLLHALPKLLAPILPVRGAAQNQEALANGANGQSFAPLLTQEQASLLLARRAAFQPRQYVAMTGEIVGRTRPDSGFVKAAIDLSGKIATYADARIPMRQRILEDRKRKREASQQMGGPMTFVQSVQAQRELVAQSDPAAQRKQQRSKRPFAGEQGRLFPGERMLKTRGVGDAASPSDGEEPTRDTLEDYLDNWHEALASADVEAARNISTDVSSFWRNADPIRATIRVCISSLGVAWCTSVFRRSHTLQSRDADENSWQAQIESINIRAASEVRRAATGDSNDSSLPMSAFPLYRRLTAEIQAKASSIRTTPSPRWHPIGSTLFCLAALSHLHERDAATLENTISTTSSSEGVVRGQTAVLDAIARWNPNMPVEGVNVASTSQDGAESAQDEAVAALAEVVGESAVPTLKDIAMSQDNVHQVATGQVAAEAPKSGEADVGDLPDPQEENGIRAVDMWQAAGDEETARISQLTQAQHASDINEAEDGADETMTDSQPLAEPVAQSSKGEIRDVETL